MMNSRVDEIQDFIKMNIPTSTDNKKGKHSTCHYQPYESRILIESNAQFESCAC